ncbi:MAG: TetR/AcrR family transcriptional regulator [Erysipelotrichaceae bacterium]
MERFNDKEKEILNGTIHLLNNGYTVDSIRMQIIANQCQMGKATIYDYFSNKDQLINSAFIYSFDLEIEKIKQLDISNLSYYDSLTYFAENIARFHRNENTFKLITRNYTKELIIKSFNVKFIEFKAVIHQIYHQILLKGQKENILDHVDLEYMTYIMDTLFEKYNITSSIYADDKALDKQFEFIKRTIINCAR